MPWARTLLRTGRWLGLGMGFLVWSMSEHVVLAQQPTGGYLQGPSTQNPPYVPPNTYLPPNTPAPYPSSPTGGYPGGIAPTYPTAPPGTVPTGTSTPGNWQPVYTQTPNTAVPTGQPGQFLNTQSSGVQNNNPLPGALPAPGAPIVTAAPAPVGYGAPGTFGSSATTATQVAPGATGSVNGQGGSAAAVAPGAFTPAGDPMLGFTTPTPYQPRIREAPIDIYVQEARTGRVVLGGSVNSDLGVAGQVIIDERNFDWRRLPTSWGDLFAGRAFRGAGQNFRAELMPGTNVQRYTVNFTQPHLFGYSPISFSLGGFLFTRQFRDWSEQRLGGRMALGYDITRDLSATTELRLEDVNIFNPRVQGVPQLDNALGSNDVYTGRFRLAHDTRDSPFMATEGHLIEMIYDQVFGEYDFPRGQLNYSRYFLIRERADGGGRHTLAATYRAGITGADTPIFETFYAGGYSTMRGFSFRGASPQVDGVQVGGQMMFLGSLEYLFPLTADDMLRGIVFCDYGTVSPDINFSWDYYRIAPGFGFRVNVPALGPAPLAFDFAFPVKYVDTDDRQVFSFFMGFTR